jgi:hypothetical protein
MQLKKEWDDKEKKGKKLSPPQVLNPWSAYENLPPSRGLGDCFHSWQQLVLGATQYHSARRPLARVLPT